MGKQDSAPPHFLQVLILTFALLSPVVSEAQCSEQVTVASTSPCTAEVTVGFDFPVGTPEIASLFIAAGLPNQSPNQFGDDASSFGVPFLFNPSDPSYSLVNTPVPAAFVDLSTVTFEVIFDQPMQCVDVEVYVAYTLANGESCEHLQVVPVCAQNVQLGQEQACAKITDQFGCPMTPPISNSPLDIEAQLFPDCLGGGLTVEASTNLDGEVCFPVTDGGCVELSIDNCETFCQTTVNVVDVEALRDHVLLNKNVGDYGPYSVIFGDVNQSGHISTLDLALVQRHIMGIEPFENPCLLFDPSHVVVNPTNTDSDWVGTISTEVCEGETTTMIAGLLGDVDGGCTCITRRVIPGSGSGVSDPVVLTTDTYKQEGGTSLTTTDEITFYDLAISMRLSQHEDNLINGLQLDNAIVTSEINKAEGLAVIIITAYDEPITLPAGTTLATLTGRQEIKEVVKSNVYFEDGSTSTVELVKSTEKRSASNNTSDEGIDLTYYNGQLRLVANQSHDQVSITAYSIAGKLLWTEGLVQLHKGVNTMTTPILESGIVIFQVQSGEGFYTLKAMISR